MISEDLVLSLSPDASIRNVGDEAVILMVRSGQIYTCNETARFFIAELNGDKTVGAVADAMGSEYDVDRKTLISDLSELLEYLIEEGVLVGVA